MIRTVAPPSSSTSSDHDSSPADVTDRFGNRFGCVRRTFRPLPGCDGRAHLPLDRGGPPLGRSRPSQPSDDDADPPLRHGASGKPQLRQLFREVPGRRWHSPGHLHASRPDRTPIRTVCRALPTRRQGHSTPHLQSSGPAEGPQRRKVQRFHRSAESRWRRESRGNGHVRRFDVDVLLGTRSPLRAVRPLLQLHGWRDIVEPHGVDDRVEGWSHQ